MLDFVLFWWCELLCLPQLRVDKWWGNRKELATVRTICSHVQNMIKGVTLVREFHCFTNPSVTLQCHPIHLCSAMRGRLVYFPVMISFVWLCSHIAGHCWKNNFPDLPLQLIACVSLTAGFPVQNAFRVCPFPHQRSHPGEWNHGGDQELPGREVHPPCPNEAW